MSKLSDQDLETAILWLDSNEGDPDGERGACCRVAVYLEALLERRQAKEAGITVAYLRRLKAEEPQP